MMVISQKRNFSAPLNHPPGILLIFVKSLFKNEEKVLEATAVLILQKTYEGLFSFFGLFYIYFEVVFKIRTVLELNPKIGFPQIFIIFLLEIESKDLHRVHSYN